MALYNIEGRADVFNIYKNGEKIVRCTYWDKGAYPFIIANKNVYIGRESNTHSDVIVSLIGMTDDELTERMDDAIKSNNYQEIQILRKLWEKASKLIEDDKRINGRIFTKIDAKIPFNFSVISFWGGDKAKEIDNGLFQKLLRKFNISENNLLVAVFDKGYEGKLIPYAEWSKSISENDDYQKQAYAIHLMNSRDKRNATDDFRRVRDRKIGRKLTNDKGEEMPMAKYRSMVYAESKQPKTIILTEGQFNRCLIENKECVSEGLGNWIKGAALGGMMALSPMQGNAQNQNYQQNDSIRTTMQNQQEMSVEQLAKIFPAAYRDRNANAQVWQQNQNDYVVTFNGKINLVGKIAASHGQNPWDALVKKYCPSKHNQDIFSLDDFDIQ